MYWAWPTSCTLCLSKSKEIKVDQHSSTSVSNIIKGGGLLLYFNCCWVPVILGKKIIKNRAKMVIKKTFEDMFCFKLCVLHILCTHFCSKGANNSTTVPGQIYILL